MHLTEAGRKIVEMPYFVAYGSIGHRAIGHLYTRSMQMLLSYTLRG